MDSSMIYIIENMYILISRHDRHCRLLLSRDRMMNESTGTWQEGICGFPAHFKCVHAQSRGHLQFICDFCIILSSHRYEWAIKLLFNMNAKPWCCTWHGLTNGTFVCDTRIEERLSTSNTLVLSLKNIKHCSHNYCDLDSDCDLNVQRTTTVQWIICGAAQTSSRRL